MSALENRVDTRIQIEVEDRRKQNDDMTQNITDVMERLQKLETSDWDTDRGRPNRWRLPRPPSHDAAQPLAAHSAQVEAGTQFPSLDAEPSAEASAKQAQSRPM